MNLQKFLVEKDLLTEAIYPNSLIAQQKAMNDQALLTLKKIVNVKNIKLGTSYHKLSSKKMSGIYKVNKKFQYSFKNIGIFAANPIPDLEKHPKYSAIPDPNYSREETLKFIKELSSVLITLGERMLEIEEATVAQPLPDKGSVRVFTNKLKENVLLDAYISEVIVLNN